MQEAQRPINVWPYKYEHNQKDEIEKLIKQMMAVGFIRPSKSPFFSPVLLVRNKDGGCGFALIIRRLIKPP